jgi:hypothetical protein
LAVPPEPYGAKPATPTGKVDLAYHSPPYERRLVCFHDRTDKLVAWNAGKPVIATQ